MERFRSRFNARLSRRAMAHAAGLFVMAGTLLVSLPRPVHAQARIVWETLDFIQLQCMDETGDGGGGAVNRFRERRNSDEPYVVLVAADIRARNHPDPRLRIPRLFVTRTDVFEGVDNGNRRDQTIRLWPISGPPSPRGVGDDRAIFLAAVMEHDRSDVDAIVAEVRGILSVNLAGYMASRMDRATIVIRMIQDMDAVLLRAAERTGGGNPDDRIGRTQHLSGEIGVPYVGRIPGRQYEHTDYDTFVGGGGRYRIHWRSVEQY